MNKHHLGPLIRQIRQARGIAINELARRAGMPNRHCNLSRYERGLKNSLRPPECLYPIADALDTSVPALFLMQEICIADPSIVGSPSVLLEHLERVTNEMDRLVARIAWKPLRVANG
jgi:transcriptional regulator with XRE-family HTH domain